MKSFALNLTFIMRFTATRKWPIVVIERIYLLRILFSSQLSGFASVIIGQINYFGFDFTNPGHFKYTRNTTNL